MAESVFYMDLCDFTSPTESAMMNEKRMLALPVHGLYTMSGDGTIMLQDMYTVASNPILTQNAKPHLGVLFAGESQTKPGHRLGPKVYDFYLMHIVLSGKGTFTCSGESYPLQAGHTFLIEPEQLISYESDSEHPWLYRWVAFHGEQAGALAGDAGFSVQQPVLFTEDMRRAGAIYRQIYTSFRAGAADAGLKSVGLLYLLFAEYSKAREAESGGPARDAHGEQGHLLKQVIHYLSTQYAHPVSIEQMAETLGYNRAYLSRIFKAQTGVTPVTFLLKLRIDKARQLLRERPDLTIEQIAASVGLQDALYFSKQFRRLHGQSPSAYREAMLRLPKS